MYITRCILAVLAFVAVANAQFIPTELISYYSDADCKNQTGYFYSRSGAPPGPSGCTLNPYSDQYVTYTYNVSEPVIERFIGYRVSLGGCPIYSDALYASSAALPGACMTDPRSGNSSFMLMCNQSNTQLTFYASDGANCNTTLGQNVEAGSCTTVFFFTIGGWCEGGGRLSLPPHSSQGSVLYGSSIVVLVSTLVIGLLTKLI